MLRTLALGVLALVIVWGVWSRAALGRGVPDVFGKKSRVSASVPFYDVAVIGFPALSECIYIFHECEYEYIARARAPGRFISEINRNVYRLNDTSRTKICFCFSEFWGGEFVKSSPSSVRNNKLYVGLYRVGGRLPGVLPVYTEFEIGLPDRVIIGFNQSRGDADICSKLPLSGIAGNPIRSESKPQSHQNQYRAYSTGEASDRCPPGRVSRCIRRFPLSAQIGISLIIALSALLGFARAVRPTSLLVITRCDAFQSAGAALLGIGLLWLSFRVWIMGG